MAQPIMRMYVAASISAFCFSIDWTAMFAGRPSAVVTISRIKPHTDFRGRFESGILNMLVIGLGKQRGANQHHRWGLRGLRANLQAALDEVPDDPGREELRGLLADLPGRGGDRPA